MTSYFTQNLCSNPSFEVSLAGYTPVEGATLALSPVSSIGQQGLEVTTPGFAIGEGVSSAIGLLPSSGTGSVSLSLFGAPGNLTVSAYISPSSSPILSSIPVTLTGTEWQRVELDGLPVLEGQELAIIVGTTSPQALTFWVDAVQIEPESPAHPYCDGDQPFCTWMGAPGLSISFQQYQFPTGSTGGMLLDGSATPVNYGAVFTTGSVGTMLLSGSLLDTVQNPVAAFNDFALFTTTDLDPAQTYPSWTTAGNSNGQTVYNRPYALFMPPLDYPVSSGMLWNRAAYMALGVYFTSVAASQAEDIADVQVELMPYVFGSAPVPTAYSPPRTIETNIKPTRLNFVPNPSIEASTTNWNAVGGASVSVAQDTTTFVPAANLTSGTVSAASLKVTLLSAVATPNNGVNVNPIYQGTTISIPDLIFGDTYIVSAWVLGPNSTPSGLADITMQIAGLNASSVGQGVGYGESTYGDGYYGGSSFNPLVPDSGTDMVAGQWYNPHVIFTATGSTVQLNFVALIDTSVVPSVVSYPLSFWIDAIMIESGDTRAPYFDGSTGGTVNFASNPDDYSWGTVNAYTGGASTPGVNTQSFFYERSIVTGANVITDTAGNGGVVQQVLNQHTPLGITAQSPMYNVPPSQ